MKINPVKIFHTPQTIDELMEMVDQYNGTERVIAMQFAMFGWNTACHLANEIPEEKNV